MITSDNILLRLAPQLIDQQRSFAFATVIRAISPTSAYIGAQAIIEADGTLHGWIGGGCAKGLVVTAAQGAIRAGKPKLVRISNDGALADADVESHAMPCASNGTIELFIQPIVPAPLLIVLGATPTAIEACILAKRMGLQVVAAATVTTPLNSIDLLQVIEGFNISSLEALAPSFILVATQGEGDEAALEAALRTTASAVLLVASVAKADRLRQAMLLRGITDERLSSLHAPAGPEMHAHTPAEIALGAITAVVALRRIAEGEHAPLITRELRRTQVSENHTSAPVSFNTYVNPVCGIVVDQASAKHVIEFGGLSHYFCCDGCKVEFEREPEKYLAIARRLQFGATT